MTEEKKTFTALVHEVLEKGLCNRCGGCVTFCYSINFGALETGKEGYPRFQDPEKCIECGLCYEICSAMNVLDDEMKRLVGWEPPLGCVKGVYSSRAADPAIRLNATDGGVVTAILCYLLDSGRIDGAIVSKPGSLMHREPWIARTREEIIAAAGSFFDQSHGVTTFGQEYSTYAPSVQVLRVLRSQGLMRVALVGTPCQITTVRKMQTLGIVPSDAIRFTLGLFCMENLSFDEQGRRKVEEIGGFSFSEVKKINVKELFMFHLRDGRVVTIPFEKLEPLSRRACMYCSDYSAEYADISFGGLASEEGWTTVIVRTPIGRDLYAKSANSVLQQYREQGKTKSAVKISEKVKAFSDIKKLRARNRLTECHHRSEPSVYS
jgi:coenzyme F420 hydrogenase subunit beta